MDIMVRRHGYRDYPKRKKPIRRGMNSKTNYLDEERPGGGFQSYKASMKAYSRADKKIAGDFLDELANFTWFFDHPRGDGSKKHRMYSDSKPDSLLFAISGILNNEEGHGWMTGKEYDSYATVCELCKTREAYGQLRICGYCKFNPPRGSKKVKVNTGHGIETADKHIFHNWAEDTNVESLKGFTRREQELQRRLVDANQRGTEEYGTKKWEPSNPYSMQSDEKELRDIEKKREQSARDKRAFKRKFPHGRRRNR